MPKFMLFLFVIIFPFGIKASNTDEAKRSIKMLIQPLLPLSQRVSKDPKEISKFSVDGCEKKKIDWMGVLMMKTTATLDFKFKANCDIEGVVTPKVFQPFPMKLKLRNLESYNHVITQNKVNASFESKPTLSLEMREGYLTGKEKVRFEVDYAVVINPMAEKSKRIEKNLGGEIRITEINGQKANIKEKILIEQD